MVEHTLGKGGVGSSILLGGTIINILVNEKNFMNDEIKNRIQTLGESKNSALHFLFEYITIKARNKFFEYFIEFTDYKNDKSVIDIGTTPSLDLEDNFFLHKVKKNQNITCFSNQDCSNLSKNFPNIKKFIIGDARHSNLKNNFFDIVH